MRINLNNLFNFGIHRILNLKTHFWIDQNNIEQKKTYYRKSIIKREPKKQKLYDFSSTEIVLILGTVPWGLV